MAVNELGSANVVTLSFKYGQRHEKELESAQKIADFYGLAHYVYDLTSIFAYSDCSLLSSSKEKPEHMSYADQIARDGEGKVSTYVPFRNGLMLSAAAALAQSLYPEEECGIWIGAHADDAAGNAYADCSVAFNESMGRAISIGTYELVKLHAPLNRLNKAQVVAEGLKLGVPYDLTWSCYEGGEKACGKCATCIDRLAAFRANGCEDPIDYED
jgi:Predicted PP-loop superfamily ATPase